MATKKGVFSFLAIFGGSIWFFLFRNNNSRANPQEQRPAQPSNANIGQNQNDQREFASNQRNERNFEPRNPQGENLRPPLQQSNPETQVENSRNNSEPSSSDRHLVSIKVKYGENVLEARINLEIDTVLSLKQKLFPNQLQEGKNVRLIFRGQVLNDSHPLCFYQISEGVFIHAVISSQPSSPISQMNPHVIPFFVTSSLPLISICGSVIGSLWAFYFIEQTSRFFDSLSLFFLTLITLLYITFLYTWITNRQQPNLNQNSLNQRN